LFPLARGGGRRGWGGKTPREGLVDARGVEGLYAGTPVIFAGAYARVRESAGRELRYTVL